MPHNLEPFKIRNFMDKFEEKQPNGESKFIRILNVVATIMAVAMYVTSFWNRVRDSFIGECQE